MADPSQLPFNFDAPKLPAPSRLPSNIEKPKMLYLVKEDFRQSENYLIITGYSSLDFLLGFFREEPIETNRKTRIVLGHEDLQPQRVSRLGDRHLSQEIVDFWLEKGISVIHCGAVLHLINLIEAGRVEFRTLQRLHAKLYVGDEYAVLGSSNFSNNGLQFQLEANIRVKKGEKDYDEIKEVADYYYKESNLFNHKLIELLKQLLGKVTWEEALARAIALLIEGDWWKEFRDIETTLKEFQLWPSQEKAIGKSLYILDNHGSVLLADPTGSGKTRTGAALHLALAHRLMTSGRRAGINDLLLTPPKVMENWQREYLDANSNFSSIVSHGTLSSGNKESVETAIKRLRNAHILLVDEAHNFLNKLSNRSQEIAKSLAEHIILFTATPINRNREDLFRLIELLDIDNFPEEIIRLYKDYAFRREELRGSELRQFKNILSHFVVRRTKRELNQMISKEPDRYLNRLGNPCRYPEQIEEVYSLDESPEDVQIAKKINKLAENLLGITRLQKLSNLRARQMSKEEQEDYLRMRLRSAAGLSRHMVQDALRSSTAALLEHLYGTEEIAKYFGIKGLPKNKDTGYTIGNLKKLKEKLPTSNLQKIDLPFWLRDEESYRQACDEELERYEKIGALAKNLSFKREERKIKQLFELLQQHQLVIGFDRHVISLYYFDQLLEKYNCRKLLVTGGRKNQFKEAKKIFRLGSTERNCIGLFSDAMSEGVNLQGGSALVMLDMPSVVRLAEQRIGRIDRMDSPYPSVDIYWPDDHESFALKTDERFFKTAEDVEQLLGGNFKIPDKLTAIRGKDVIRLRREAIEAKEQEMQDLFPDAFQAVEGLVAGEKALISFEIYEQLRHSEARVFANVSIVRSKVNWAFFALEGAAQYAPRWLFIDPEDNLITDLPSICQNLREWLPKSQNMEYWDGEVTEVFDYFVSYLKNSQIDQLPLKKQRAIQLFIGLLKYYQKNRDLNQERRGLLRESLGLFSLDSESDFSVDYDHLGRLLIRLFQPRLQKLRLESRRRVITMKNLEKIFKKDPINDETLREILSQVQWVRAIDRRVVACIVGIGEG